MFGILRRRGGESEHREEEKLGVITRSLELLRNDASKDYMAGRTFREASGRSMEDVDLNGQGVAATIYVDTSTGEVKFLGWQKDQPLSQTEVTVELRTLIGAKTSKNVDYNSYIYQFEAGNPLAAEAETNLNEIKAKFNIGQARNWESFFNALRMTRQIPISREKMYTPEEMIAFINEVREGVKDPNLIPKTYGIYDKMIKLIINEAPA